MTVGRTGEEIAARLVGRRGYRIIDRNVAFGDGEIDLLARGPGGLTVIEVKTIIGAEGAPLTRIDREKSRRLWRLAHRVGANRVEVIGLRLTSAGVLVEWLPG